jgi:hypothetical protein
MIFSAFYSIFYTEMGPDGDSAMTLPEVGSTDVYASAAGGRLNALLKAFTRATLYLFTANQAITVTAGDREFSFLDSANCALEMFDVRKVWITEYLIKRCASVNEILSYWDAQTPAGTPQKWAQLSRTQIVFDVEVEENLADCSVQGYYRHPTIAADNQALLVSDEDLLMVFLPYAMANFRQNAAQEEIGMARLRQSNEAAFAGMMKIRGDRLRLMNSSERY